MRNTIAKCLFCSVVCNSLNKNKEKLKNQRSENDQNNGN